MTWGWHELTSATGASPLFFKEIAAALARSRRPVVPPQRRAAAHGRGRPALAVDCPAALLKDVKASLEVSATRAAQALTDNLLDRFPEAVVDALSVVHHKYWRLASKEKLIESDHKKRFETHLRTLEEQWGAPGKMANDEEAPPLLNALQLRRQRDKFIQTMMGLTCTYLMSDLSACVCVAAARQMGITADNFATFREASHLKNCFFKAFNALKRQWRKSPRTPPS